MFGGRSRLCVADWCCCQKENISMASKARYILLKDVQGFKQDGAVKSVLKKTIGGDPYSLTNVLRGELVEERTLPELNFNMRLCRDHSILMFTNAEDVAPLNPEEFSLMEGIENASDRILTFNTGGIEFGMNLVQGSKVYVALYGPGNLRSKYARATVQYKGTVQGLPGTVFGVEIQQKESSGNGNDGSFRGKQYFQCEDGFGMFVSLSRLSRYQSPNLHKQRSHSSQEELKEITSFPDASGYKEGPPSSNTRQKSKVTESSVDYPSVFKVDDRVQFFDKHGKENFGTVKWTGNKTISRTFEFMIIGIYTDEEVYKTDFENSVPGLSHLISAPKNRSLFIPESMADKIGPKKENVIKKGGIEESITTIIANSDKKSKEELLREQKEMFEEASHKKMEEEFAHAMKESGEDFQEQLQRMKKYEIENEKEKQKQRKDQQEMESHSTHQTYDSSEEHRNIHQKVDPSYYHQGTGDGLSAGRPLHHERKQEAASCGVGPPYHFDINSMVQIPCANANSEYKYGVIRWIGEIPNTAGEIAGIELEDFMEGCADGTWTDSDGTNYRFFKCPSGKGLFYPLNRVQPDSRYSAHKHHNNNPLADVAERVPLGVNVAPHTDIMHYVGEKKGIQGHQNSCYLDATVFGLFALSEDFDEMFLRDTDSRVGEILWQKIVNPLRQYGVVKYESIMDLRKELEQLGKMSGITSDEKDPEEFLNLMFKHSLKVEPFISIRRPFGVEPEYFVQLFVELSDSNKPAQIGHLLTKMFKEQSISFTQVPSKLLIQVPRHGKKFQSFQKIIPEIQIDIAEVTDSIYTGNCFFCEEEKATKICGDCYKNFGSQSILAFCGDCYTRSHKHSRKNHQWQPCETGESKLDLLSVLCIETSHYVCFTRRDKRWLFFDSMSNRVYDQYNIPRVDDCSKELNEWVYPANKNIDRLVRTPSRELPERVRRFTQDIYMCVYVQEGWNMY